MGRKVAKSIRMSKEHFEKEHHFKDSRRETYFCTTERHINDGALEGHKC